MRAVEWLGGTSLTFEERDLNEMRKDRLRRSAESEVRLRSGRAWAQVLMEGLVVLEREPPSSDAGGKPVRASNTSVCCGVRVHRVTDTRDSHPC